MSSVQKHSKRLAQCECLGLSYLLVAWVRYALAGHVESLLCHLPHHPRKLDPTVGADIEGECDGTLYEGDYEPFQPI